MRKMLLSILFLGFLCPLSAQFYTSAFGGYGVPIMGHQLGFDFSPSPSGYTLFHGMYASLGRGSSIGGSVGYCFSGGFIAELEYGKFDGVEVTSGYVDSSAGFVTVTSNTHISARGYRLVPNIGFKLDKGRFSFTSQSGLLVGLNMEARVRRVMEWPGWVSSIIFIQEEKLTKPVAFGFEQKVGIQFYFLEHFAAQIDVRGVFQNWAPKYGELTKSEYDGRDQLQNASYGYSHYVYVEEFTEPNLSMSSTDRGEKMKIVLPLSSITFTAGITYSFGIRQAATPK